MTKTKSNWCHLLIWSWPQYILQLLYWDPSKLLNKIWRTRNANVMNCISTLRNLKCWKLQQIQSCGSYWRCLDGDSDLATLTSIVVYKLYYNCYKRTLYCFGIVSKIQGFQLGYPKLSTSGLGQNSGVPKQHCIESCQVNLTRLGTKLALDH